DLEGRTRVIVQSANESRVHSKTDPPGDQVRFELFEVFAAGVAEPVRNCRQLCNHGLARRNLAIENTKRVRLPPPSAVFAQPFGAAADLAPQRLNIGWTALRVAYGVDVHLEIRNPEAAKKAREHLNDFRFDRRIVRAREHFRPALYVLSV